MNGKIMNIAILFVGQQRWFDLTNQSYISNFLPVLKDHNVKYFSHLWNMGNIDLDTTKSKDGFKQFENLYSPNVIELELNKSPLELYSFFKMKKEIHNSLLSQTYSFYKSFSLLAEYQRKNSMCFDLYIKMRTDLVFLNKIKIDNLDSESIYTKDMGDWRPSSNYVHDFMFLTKSFINLEKMANMGFEFDQILEDFDSLLYTNDYNGSVCPEEILARQLVNNKLQQKPYDFNIDLARNLNHSFTIENVDFS